MRFDRRWLMYLTVLAAACAGEDTATGPGDMPGERAAQDELDPKSGAAADCAPHDEPAAESDFCPAYTESPLFRRRARQVVVGPNDDWIRAIESAAPGTEILLRDGEYDTGGDRAIHIRDEVTVRGQSGDRSRVIIRGAGLDTPSEGLFISGRNVTIADLSVTGMRNHAISIKGEMGAQAPHIYNVHLFDVGTKLIKLSPGGTANGVIACSEIGYSPGAVRGDYVAAADLHEAIDWVIRDNVMYNVWGDGSGCNVDTNCGTYDSGRALLIWNRARGVVIERNIFLDNYRDISLGLDRGFSGGVIRNNFMLRTRRGGSASIEMRTTTNTLVAHNTIRMSGDRWAMNMLDSSGVRVINNLMSAPLQDRGGNRFESRGNIFDANDGDFAAEDDYHLRAGSRALGRGVAVDGVPDDIEGQHRGAVRDVGADQVSGVDTAPPAADEPAPEDPADDEPAPEDPAGDEPAPEDPADDEPAAEAADFCPAYTESPLFRRRARQVVVGPGDDWIRAIEGAAPGTEILLRDGEYRTGGRRKIELGDDITVRGRSGDPRRVVIRGAGLDTPAEGLYVTGRNVTIADLSVTAMRNYAISIKGELGAQAPHIYNVHLFDVGTKLIKLSPGGSANGVIACSRIGYSPGAIRGDYVAAADLHQPIDWVIRDNVMYNVWGDGSGCNVDTNCGTYDSGRALLIWNRARGVVIERNIFLNNYRDISLGLDRGFDGGVIRNNFMLRTRRGGSASIEIRTTTDTLIAHNTIRMSGDRFAMNMLDSSGVRIINNLMSAPLQDRGGNRFESRGNIFDANDGDFAAEDDYHLRAGSRALGRGVAVNGVPDDIEGQPRGAVRDVGADQVSGVGAAPPADDEPADEPPADEPPADDEPAGDEPEAADFCPPYTESPLFRRRSRQVVVGPNDDWAGTIERAGPGTEVLLRDGVYNLGNRARIRIGADVTVRGQSGNRERVIIRGVGYSREAEPLYVTGRNVTIADLSVEWVRGFAISLKGELGATAPHIYNVHLRNTGRQHIKLSPGASANGVIACSAIGYDEGAVRGDYIDAIDLHNAINYVIRDNYIYNITGEGNGCNVDTNCGTYYTGPAILVWNDSRGTIIERNVLVDNHRNISLGLDRGHEGGIIRNNFIYRTWRGDVGIELRTSRNVLVAHNTVWLPGGQNAMHLLESSGIRIINNLFSGPIQDRGRTDFVARGNILDANANDFAERGDFHLRPGSRAIGRGVAVDGVPEDMDGEPRGAVRDVGADQVSR